MSGLGGKADSNGNDPHPDFPQESGDFDPRCQCPLSDQSRQSEPRWSSPGHKAESGRLSQAQCETHDAITLAGGVVTTCCWLDDVAAFLATLGVPSRAGAPYSAISGQEAAFGHQKRLHRAARAAGRAAKGPRRHHWHDD